MLVVPVPLPCVTVVRHLWAPGEKLRPSLGRLDGAGEDGRGLTHACTPSAGPALITGPVSPSRLSRDPKHIPAQFGPDELRQKAQGRKAVLANFPFLKHKSRQ